MQTVVNVDGRRVNLSAEGDLPVLGWTIFGSFSSDAVEYDKVAEQIAWCGLSSAVDLLTKPTGQATLKMAVQEWARGRARAKGVDAEIAERIDVKSVHSADGKMLAYLLQVEQADRRELSLRADTDVRILYFKESKAIYATYTRSGGSVDEITEERSLTQEIGDAWARLAGLIAGRAVREFFERAVLRAGGIRVHEKVSLYFLPASSRYAKDALVRLAQRLRTSLDYDCSIATIVCRDDEETRASLTALAQESLLNELDRIKAEIDNAKPDQQRGKEQAVVRRLGRIDEMKAKIDKYASLLDVRRTRFGPTIEELETQTYLLGGQQPRQRRREQDAAPLVLPVREGAQRRRREV